jgi:hypothetical protein
LNALYDVRQAGSLPQTLPESHNLDEMQTNLLSRAIDCVDFFEKVQEIPSQQPTYHYLHRPPTKVANSKSAELFITTALRTKNELLVIRIVEQLIATENIPHLDVQERTRNVLLPIVKVLEDRICNPSLRPALEHSWTKLCNQTINFYFQGIANTVPTKADISAVLSCASVSKNPELLTER